jgi:hypothetical protein
MATKKQNKRSNVRKARRLLNLHPEFSPKITGRRINKLGWGAGLNNCHIKEKEMIDPEDYYVTD